MKNMIKNINEINQTNLKINFNKFYDISIHQNFNSEQPNSFGVSKAISNPFKEGNFIGDTNKGGSCNFDELKIIPHCNGTHTECIGHILNSRDKITDLLDDVFIHSLLITCQPILGSVCKESYLPSIDSDDLIITKSILQKEIGNFKLIDNALIIRTLPNENNKKSIQYPNTPSTYFSNDAMMFIVELGIKHLLVDLPSVDKANDSGILSNHRIYWDVEIGQKDKSYSKSHHKTITEFIFVDNKINDGQYLLNLQIAPFGLDASPSRPILIEISNV